MITESSLQNEEPRIAIWQKPYCEITYLDGNVKKECYIFIVSRKRDIILMYKGEPPKQILIGKRVFTTKAELIDYIVDLSQKNGWTLKMTLRYILDNMKDESIKKDSSI